MKQPPVEFNNLVKERNWPAVVYFINNHPEYRDYSNIDFTGANLKNVNFNEAKLTDVIFTGAILQGASFKNASINKVNFDSANLSDANFYQASLSYVTASETNFTAVNFSKAKIADSEFENSEFSCVVAIETEFRDVEINNGHFRNANLERSQVYNCLIDSCDIADSNMSSMKIDLSNILCLTLNNVKLIYSAFFSSLIEDNTIANCWSPYTSFDDCSLGGNNIENCSFKGAVFHSNTFKTCKIVDSDFQGVAFDPNNKVENSTFLNVQTDSADLLKEIEAAGNIDFTKPEWGYAVNYGSLKHVKDNIYSNIDGQGVKRYWRHTENGVMLIPEDLPLEDGPVVETNNYWYKEGKYVSVPPAVEATYACPQPTVDVDDTLKGKEEKNMSFSQMINGDMEKVAYRVARKQMYNGVKNALLIALQAKASSMSDEQLKLAKQLLESEIGEAIIDGLLGLALTYTPKICDDPRAKVLAEEFRVQSIATVGNAVLDSAIGVVTPLLSGALNNIPLPEVPTKEKVRVDAKAPAHNDHEEIEQLHAAENPAPKKSKQVIKTA